LRSDQLHPYYSAADLSILKSNGIKKDRKDRSWNQQPNRSRLLTTSPQSVFLRLLKTIALLLYCRWLLKN